MGPLQIPQLWVSVGLGVTAIAQYSIFTKFPVLEPHHMIQFSILSCGWAFLSAEIQSAHSTPQETGLYIYIYIYI